LLNYFGFTKEQQAEAGRDSNIFDWNVNCCYSYNYKK